MSEYNYTNLTPFKWFILENFPFIEASFDTLTNYQLFCKLGEEMNKIIDKVNESGEEVENLSNAFISLQNYINNYFSNLDVQEEIDNKLDEMAIQGTLQEIILEYLNTKGCLYFNTVNEMINYQYFNEGAFVKTGGYYEINDGKDATYKIISNTTGYDETNIIELNNNLYALDITNIKYNRPFRILLMSDIHYKENSQYGYQPQERLKMLIDDIMTEHKKQPIDAVLILGDLSTDNMGAPNASSTLYGTNYVKKLFSDYLYKLPCPVYTLPGNHDSWNNDVWKSITGYNREYSIIFDDMAFIMLDTFNSTSPNGAGAIYKGVNTTFLNNELKKFKNKKIFLFAHYFDKNNESETFKNIVKNNDNIIALFCGHSHNYRTYNLGEEYGNKMLYMTGNYSYSLNGSITIYNPDTTWGFRNLKLTENGIETEVIRPSHTFLFDNINYTHTYSIEDNEIITRQIVYKNTSNYHIEKDTNNNLLPEILREIYKKVYTLEDSLIIEKNSDLNNIQNPGIYISPNLTTTETLNCGGENLPYTNGGFRLINQKNTGNIGENESSRFITQYIFPTSEYDFCWFRIKTPANRWTDWKKVITEDDLKKQSYRLDFGINNKSLLKLHKSGNVVSAEFHIAFEDLQTLTSPWTTKQFDNVIPEDWKPSYSVETGAFSPYLNDNAINSIYIKINENTRNLRVTTGVSGVSLDNSGSKWVVGYMTYIL